MAYTMNIRYEFIKYTLNYFNNNLVYNDMEENLSLIFDVIQKQYANRFIYYIKYNIERNHDNIVINFQDMDIFTILKLIPKHLQNSEYLVNFLDKLDITNLKYKESEVVIEIFKNYKVNDINFQFINYCSCNKKTILMYAIDFKQYDYVINIIKNNINVANYIFNTFNECKFIIKYNMDNYINKQPQIINTQHQNINTDEYYISKYNFEMSLISNVENKNTSTDDYNYSPEIPGASGLHNYFSSGNTRSCSSQSSVSAYNIAYVTA